MDRNAAYENLAEWFEYLNDDCDYENWSQYLIEVLRGYPLQTGLDIGCGGGYFTRALQKAGCKMTGIDCSAQMLDKAQRTALETGIRSEYILWDIAAKKPVRKYSFATAINDCINYIPKEKLARAFKNICAALERGGVFFFDISSERKLRQKVANTVSVDDRDEITYLNFSSLDGDEVTMDVTLFVKGADGKYIRLDERHTQYIYKEEEIVSALENSGFTLLKCEGRFGKESEKDDRICFLAQKR
ncbi:MAG: methyltransferase domain-containing protein [Clostridia bacterium]|nr:methyltransferase domain-containing protein [Clostridia bacterium]